MPGLGTHAKRASEWFFGTFEILVQLIRVGVALQQQHREVHARAKLAPSCAWAMMG